MFRWHGNLNIAEDGGKGGGEGGESLVLPQCVNIYLTGGWDKQRKTSTEGHEKKFEYRP
jgi:hypothetical protein